MVADSPAGSAYFGGLYDATRIVRSSGHVHVAMNYRLGAFGFLALDSLLRESNTTGNYGLLDQQLAMRWVRDNRAALRIDYSRVTLFGESAGAFSVCWHLVSPESAPLFTRAIMESANCDSDSFFVALADAESYAATFLAQFGCGADDAARARVASPPATWWRPTLAGRRASRQ
jgi:para-nitrobenzyl esterase